MSDNVPVDFIKKNYEKNYRKVRVVQEGAC